MGVIRVTPLKDFRATALSTSVTGTAYSTQVPVSGQSVYGALHLTQGYASTARMLVASIQSASSSGFGAVTSEIQFALSTDKGSTWGTLASPSTDRPWRRSVMTMSTAASTGGSWKGMIFVGIR